jgi:hypothetical protein
MRIAPPGLRPITQTSQPNPRRLRLPLAHRSLPTARCRDRAIVWLLAGMLCAVSSPVLLLRLKRLPLQWPRALQ